MLDDHLLAGNRHVDGVNALLVMVLSAFWLISSGRIIRFALSLRPRGDRRSLAVVLNELNAVMAGYVRARLATAVATGVLLYAALLLIGVDHPLALAVVTALAKLVPVLGGLIGAVLVVGMASLESLQQATATAVAYAAVQIVASYVLLPRLLRREGRTPAVLAISAILVGGSAGGMVGVLVAVPIAGALQVLTLRVLAPTLRRIGHSEALRSRRMR